MTRSLLVAVVAGALLAVPATAGAQASAPPPASASGIVAAGAPPVAIVRARIGRGIGGFGRSYGYGRSRYGYGVRRGHPFLHGLFVGWLLSHVFGGGFPLFPLFLIAFFFLFARRRRRYGPRAVRPRW